MDQRLISYLVELGQVLAQADHAAYDWVNQLISQQPLLLDEMTLADLDSHVAVLTSTENRAMGRALGYLRLLRQRCLSDPRSYPLGDGPLEGLWEQVWAGEISIGYGEQRAAADASAVLSDVYALAVSAFALETSRGGDWRRAFEVERLLLAAARTFSWAEAGKWPRGDAARWVAEREWLEVAHSILSWLPHRGVYHDAMAAGGQLLSSEAPGRSDKDRGLILLRMGTLHVGPYTVDKSSGDYDLGIRLWNQRLAEEVDSREIARLEQSYPPLPSPQEALTAGAGYLRSAMPLLSGADRGLCAKALVQALHWSGLLGETVSSEEILSVGRESLDLLPGPGNAHFRAAVVAMMADHGYAVSDDTITDLLGQSFDEVVRRTGKSEALDLLLQVTDILWRIDPARALNVARDGRELVQAYASDERQQIHLVEEIRLLAEVYAAEIPDDASGDLGQRAQIIRQRAQEENWDARTLSASLLGLASLSPDTDEEGEGLVLLEEAAYAAPLFVQEFASAFAFLAAELTFDRAGVAEQHSLHAAAGEGFALAAKSFCELGLPEATQDSLLQLQRIAASGDPDTAGRVVAVLGDGALAIEKMLGEQSAQRLQAVYGEAAKAAWTSQDQSAPADVLIGLIQLANGWRFAATIAAGAELAEEDDEEGVRLLAAIQESELAAHEPDESIGSPEEILDEEILLGQYIRPETDRPGQTAAERLANLMHSFDAYLSDRVLRAETGYAPRPASVHDIQRVLDQNTVLITLMPEPGPKPDAAPQIWHGLALTDTEAVPFSGSQQAPAPGGGMGTHMRGSGSGFTLGGTGPRVAEVRQAVQEEPGARRLSRRAEELLRSDFGGLFGTLAAHLDRWHGEGRGHLIVVPYGAMQYYPFHLLIHGERPLAEKWAVTYLPSLALVFRPTDRSPVAVRLRQSMTAIGIGFAGTPDALPEAPAESRAIADAVGGSVLPEADASPEGLIRALCDARCVHLATHGRHAVTAPAFQYLQTPSGPLYAHQITSLDLRGLTLLTLSACETGLGRVDSAANIRGLPAAFIQSGTSTLVVTMWQVETATSQLFFTSFYAHLAAGCTRREAFVKAQSSTRQRYPDFRDWGAFVLLGDWT